MAPGLGEEYTLTPKAQPYDRRLGPIHDEPPENGDCLRERLTGRKWLADGEEGEMDFIPAEAACEWTGDAEPWGDVDGT